MLNIRGSKEFRKVLQNLFSFFEENLKMQFCILKNKQIW